MFSPFSLPSLNRLRFLLPLALVSLLPSRLPGSAPTDSGAALEAELRIFQQTAGVLYVAAHPDDENTHLIAYLARGRGYRTGYLSLTRGDGGQNVLGPDLGDKLGVARTQELLEARRLDGGRQFFTRALDFGFSKDYRETLSIWNREEVLSDMVRVIRTFRPDVIVTRFSTQPGGTHGHHTASAVLAVEAARLAGDPSAFPDQLGELKPWQTRRVFWNAWPARNDVSKALKLEISGRDSALGISLVELATRSRSQHKTQGFDKIPAPDPHAPRHEYFQLLDGEPAQSDIMDGVDSSWNRFPGGARVAELAAAAGAAFRREDPGASVPALLELRQSLTGLPADPVISQKRAELDALLQACLRLQVKTTVPATELVAGEALPLQHSVSVGSSMPVRWTAVRYPAIGRTSDVGITLSAGEPVTRDDLAQVPSDHPVSQPYWLRQQPTAGMARVDDVRLIGTPENPPVFPVEMDFEVGGQVLTVVSEPVLAARGQPGAAEVRHIEVIAPVSLRFLGDVELFRPGATRKVGVTLTAARKSRGAVSLDIPQGWTVSPASIEFDLAEPGRESVAVFSVTAPAGGSSSGLAAAAARIDGKIYTTDRQAVSYPHIHYQLLQPPARTRLVSVALERRGERVGYLPGAGDAIPEALRQMGYEVETLSGEELTADRLRGLDAVVIGVRAFNVRSDLGGKSAALFAFAERGGTLIVQYNNPNGLQMEAVSPVPLRISSDRVTDETATMAFLAPDHPVIQGPNPITAQDFEGWVQERGLYFPNEWDASYQPLFACGDPGETPKKGALLVARHGQGHVVYTGLSFFRQLPAGVPGAYRLFANLVSLGK